MKKLSLIAMLAILTLGVVACKPATSSSETPAPSTSQQPSSGVVSSEPESSAPTSSAPEVAALPAPRPADKANDYSAGNSSITLVPAAGSTQKAVKEFLNYEGIRFIDLRDSSEGYSIGHIERFESISYFNYIEKLYTPNADKTQFTANYELSEDYVNYLFPKNTPMFLMCQGGARVVYMMNLLKQLDYDMSYIYNVGGWSQVSKGTHDYNVTKGFGAKAIDAKGKIEYNIDLEPVEASATKAQRRADLPAARPADKANDYSASNSSITLVPAAGSTQKAVKDYLNVEGIRFIDLRDETEGYSIGHIERFESISYFNYVEKLYTPNADKTEFTANYELSEDYVNYLFPKNTPIFLMCQGGARVVYMMNLLKQLDYDMSYIYNVGGWSQVSKGTHDYNVTKGFAVNAIDAKGKLQYNIDLEPVEA